MSKTETKWIKDGAVTASKINSDVAGTGIQKESGGGALGLDINGLSASTEAVDADYLVIYDASEGGHRKILRSNFTSAVGSHGSTHAGNGSDPVPVATTSVSGLLSSTDKTNLDANTAARHARLHDIDSASDHNGITSDENDMMVCDSNGLPKSAGIRHYGSQTRTQMLALSPSAGDRCWCSTYKKEFIYNGDTWQSPGETVECTNISGGAMSEGDLVIRSEYYNNSADTTTSSYDELAFGFVVIGGSTGSKVTIATNGSGWTAKVTGTITRGNMLVSSSTDLHAADSWSQGAWGGFARALTNKTTGGTGTVTVHVNPPMNAS